MTQRRPSFALSFGTVLAAGVASCSGSEPAGAAPAGAHSDSTSRAGTVIHLEDLIDEANIEGGEVIDELAPSMTSSFSQGGTGWEALPNRVEGASPADVTEVEGALRVRLTETSRAPEGSSGVLTGGIWHPVDGFELSRWDHVLVEARVAGPMDWMGIGYNVRDEPGDSVDEQWPTDFWGAGTDVGPGEGLRTFRFAVQGQGGPVSDPVGQIALQFGARAPAHVDLVSLTFVPKSAKYTERGIGVRSVANSAHDEFGPTRRTLYVHAPTSLHFELELPAEARLDLALGAFRGTVKLRIHLETNGETRVLLDETVAPNEPWDQRSLDLSDWSGQDVTLSLVAEPAEASSPALAFWATPTVSGTVERTRPSTTRPNVIFYVIDGASAGYMSVYGYERQTTPNLERIAAEGVVFERAHSNATWTMPSTASFMTSLHHSVLGGLRDDANPIPLNVKTMAEHFAGAGFHTGVFTFNPNAGSLSGLDRGVGVFRDFGNRNDPMDPIEAVSTVVLHGQYWEWREAYPGPHWVHFQTTDVHPPHHPQPPFAGRFIPPDESEALVRRIFGLRFPFNHTSASVHEHWQEQLAQQSIDPAEFYSAMQDAHDEAMMHQDARLGELVDELKARGEWEDTLLIIGSDHGHPAASYPRFGRGQLDPQPEPWAGALLGRFESHVPLIFVWPAGIEGGRRIDAPVSMIDVLPTALDLLDLPAPEVHQGQSLVPALRGDPGWQPGPVVLDEFRVQGDGSLIGNLELLGARWGESLEIRTSEAEPSATGRHPAPAGGRWAALDFLDVPRFHLFDVRADPFALNNVAAEHPARAADARARLWELWQQHRSLATLFEAGEEAELSPEQLEALRAMGYAE